MNETTEGNKKQQIGNIKLAILDAIPVYTDKACIIIALAQLIEEMADFAIESDPQTLAVERTAKIERESEQ